MTFWGWPGTSGSGWGSRSLSQRQNPRQRSLCAQGALTAGLAATGPQSKDGNTNREQFLCGGAAATVILATERLQYLASVLEVKGAFDPGSVRTIADALSSTYDTVKCGDLLGPARLHLWQVVGSLYQVTRSERGELLAVGVDMACLCGWLTRSSGTIGDAHAYFACARGSSNPGHPWRACERWTSG